MFQSSALLLIIVSSLINQCISSISPGRCPYIEPIENFDIKKFLGRWYAIQETSTKSSCMTYDFLEGNTDGQYLLEQSSEGSVSRFNVSYKLTYTGKLTVDSSAYNKMTISYPLISVMGTVFFDVITTDYETHAAITTCQNALLLFKRQTTTFLSRTKHISEAVLKKMRLTMYNQNIDDHLLKSVRHVSCLAEHSRELFMINSNPSVKVFANAEADNDENMTKNIVLGSGDSTYVSDSDFQSGNDIVSIIGANDDRHSRAHRLRIQ